MSDLGRIMYFFRRVYFAHRFRQSYVSGCSRIFESDIGIGTSIRSGCSVSRSKIGDGTKVYSRSIVSSSTLGSSSELAASTVSDSFIGDNCDISISSVITSQIGQGAKLRGASVSNGKIGEHFGAGRGFFSDVEVGRFTYFADGAHASLANVGSFCSIGPEVICGYGDHPKNLPSTSPVFFSTAKQCGITFAFDELFAERKLITIGNDVWIGARVFIRDGLTIGDGAILGAGAVVVSDVAPYSIVGGVPAKCIGYRFPEEISVRLRRLRWWDWREDILRAAQPFFARVDFNGLFEFANLHCLDSCTRATVESDSETLSQQEEHDDY